jgi:pyruvate/2-oxoglutarate dehydrogenase complex dihydrolipoamide dehydrogenase (E3) component
MAAYQAGIVIANMIFRSPRKVNYDFVPWCTFTDPEVANVGLTEEMAKQKGIRYETVKFEFKDLDRAVCDDSEVGFLKLLLKKNRIIGAACVGPDAGNIIHELILAASAKLSILNISKAVHIYPTLAQINAKAISTYLGQKYSSKITQNMAKFMFNFFA